jgi:predicted amidohydrolase
MTDPAGPHRRTARVHIVQVAYGDREPVAERIERVSELVRAQQSADLVVLPELWSHGGFAFSTWQKRAEEITGPTVTAIAAAARSIGAVVHAGSIVERTHEGEHGLANTSVLFDTEGQIAKTYRKIHRFGFGEGEPGLIDRGLDVVTSRLHFRSGVVATAGLATCYDLRFPELFRSLIARGSELFIVPAAWPSARVEHWLLLGRARAVENQSLMLQCNTAGEHSGYLMGGHSQVVAPTGEVLAQAGTAEEVLVVDIDLNSVSDYRARFPALGDRHL